MSPLFPDLDQPRDLCKGHDEGQREHRTPPRKCKSSGLWCPDCSAQPLAINIDKDVCFSVVFTCDSTWAQVGQACSVQHCSSDHAFTFSNRWLRTGESNRAA